MSIEKASYNTIAFQTEEPALLHEPFFFNTPIPFPVSAVPSPIYNNLVDFWPLAEADFVKMAKSEGFGDPIREFFQANPSGGMFELAQLGLLVGVDKSDALRKVRSTLQIGQFGNSTSIAIWEFASLEAAQFMVGLVSKKRTNIYTRLTSSAQQPNF